MSSSQPFNPRPSAPPGWYPQPGTGNQKWWTGSEWLDKPPSGARTVPLRVFIVVGLAAFVLGIAFGSLGGSGSSKLTAANKRINQLEQQIAASGTPVPSAEPASPSTQQPSSESIPTPTVALSGDGQQNTEKVALEGDYKVSWTTLGSCYYSAYLMTEGGQREQAFTATEALSGMSNVYGLRAGDYYLDVITGPAPRCGWSVSLTPLPG
jgi:hypothetical protein